MAAEPYAHAAQLLRSSDPDRFFASLLLPEPARGAIQALFAFSTEMATVRDRVSSPQPGEIRLRWWIDALEGQEHGAVRQNPLAAALLDAIARFSLPVAPLQRLVEARRFDLYDDPMPDLPTFEGYAGETVSVLYQLSAMVLNGGKEVVPGDAAGHLGVAQALIGHLRAFGFNASRGRIFLPWSVFAANGVEQREVFAGTVSEGLLAARALLLEMAADYLDRSQRAVVAAPKHVRRAFAQMALLRRALAQLERASDNPYITPPEMEDWRKIANLAWWAWRNG